MSVLDLCNRLLMALFLWLSHHYGVVLSCSPHQVDLPCLFLSFHQIRSITKLSCGDLYYLIDGLNYLVLSYLPFQVQPHVPCANPTSLPVQMGSVSMPSRSVMELFIVLMGLMNMTGVLVRKMKSLYVISRIFWKRDNFNSPSFQELVWPKGLFIFLIVVVVVVVVFKLEWQGK